MARSGKTTEPTLEPGANLTDKQRAVLTFIERQIREAGYAPTIREIGHEFGIRSTNGVNDHLVALERKGYVSRVGQKSRTLRIVQSLEPVVAGEAESGAASDRHVAGRGAGGSVAKLRGLTRPMRDDGMVDVPLYGRVAAGAPILANDNVEDTVRVSSFLLGRGVDAHRVFALRVVGESMIDDGIHDGDFLFVKKQATARAGEIVVAMIEGEATVKRYFPEGDRIRFQPANARMEPIFVHKDEFKQTDILGVVVGLHRQL